MDTEYTKGFRAGMAWREAEIIKLLIEENYFCDGHWNHECQDTQNCTLRRSGSWHGAAPCESDFLGGNDCKRIIALIQGEK